MIEAKKTMYKLAKKHDGVIWDLFSVMGGMNSIVKWEENGLAKSDKIHFTTKGYKLTGDLFFEAFIKSYKEFIEKMGEFDVSKFVAKIFSPFIDQGEHPMIFTEYPFWIFFLVVLAGYSLFHKRLRIRSLFLFLVSIYFYYKTSGFFFSILLFLPSLIL